MLPPTDDGDRLSDSNPTNYVQINIDANIEAKINEIANQVQLSRDEIIRRGLESGLDYILEKLSPEH